MIILHNVALTDTPDPNSWHILHLMSLQSPSALNERSTEDIDM